MGHPDFRVNGRIFATLHHDRLWGMASLSPEQQETFVRQYPAISTQLRAAHGDGRDAPPCAEVGR